MYIALCIDQTAFHFYLETSYIFTDLDKFMTDDIMDPIAKAKMVALKGIKRVLTQDPMGVPPGINRYCVLSGNCALCKDNKPLLHCFCFFPPSGNKYLFWLRDWLQPQEVQTRRLTLDLDHLR